MNAPTDSQGKLSVVVAEDRYLVRQGLRVLLESAPDVRVVGEAAGGLEALRVVERSTPDVLVVQWMLPDLGAAEIVRRVLRRTGARSVVLAPSNEDVHVVRALRAGAFAYVLERDPPNDLLDAVREARAGRKFLGASVRQHAIDHFAAKALEDPVEPYGDLTERERDVLHLAVLALSNAEIAERLGISPRTVETHRSTMMRKLGLRTLSDLLRYALAQGLLPTREEADE